MTIAEQHAAFDGTLNYRQILGWRVGEWLTPQLVERAESRVRLRRWAEVGGPLGPFPLNVVGVGPKAYDAADRVAARVPAPVAWHAARHVVVAAMDRSLAGYIKQLPAMALTSPPPDEPPRLVVVDQGVEPEELETTIAHELAHSWTSGVPSRQFSAREAQHLQLVAQAIPADDPRFLQLGREEELARILPAQWGFRGAGAMLPWSPQRRQGRAVAYVREVLKP